MDVGSLPTRTALVAERDGTLRMVLTSHIRGLGFDVVEVATLEAALACASERPIELAVCDADIPGLDGLELRRRLERGAGEEVPIIFTSSRPDAARDRFILRDAPLLIHPVSRAQIREAIQYVQTRRSIQLRRHHSSLSGNLADFTVGDLCLFMREYTLSGLATFLRGGDQGAIAFSIGEPVRAETEGMEGDKAFRELLSWDRGAFDVQLRDSRAERNITSNLDSLLAPRPEGSPATREEQEPSFDKLPAVPQRIRLARGDALMYCPDDASRAALLGTVKEKMPTLATVLESGAFSSKAALGRLIEELEEGRIELVILPEGEGASPDMPAEAAVGDEAREPEVALSESPSEPEEAAPDVSPLESAELADDRASPSARPTFLGMELAWEPPEAELVDDDSDEVPVAVEEPTPPGGIRPLSALLSQGHAGEPSVAEEDTGEDASGEAPSDAETGDTETGDTETGDTEAGDTEAEDTDVGWNADQSEQRRRDEWSEWVRGEGREQASDSFASGAQDDDALPAAGGVVSSSRQDMDALDFTELDLAAAEAKWADVESTWKVEVADEESHEEPSEWTPREGPGAPILGGWKASALAMAAGIAVVVIGLSLLPSDPGPAPVAPSAGEAPSRLQELEVEAPMRPAGAAAQAAPTAHPSTEAGDVGQIAVPTKLSGGATAEHGQPPRATTLAHAAALVAVGELDGAEQVLEIVIQTEPDNARAKEMLASLWSDRGRVDEAKAVLQELVNAGQGSIEGVLTLAVLAQRDGEIDRARRLYARFLDEAAPNHAYANTVRLVLSRL